MYDMEKFNELIEQNPDAIAIFGEAILAHECDMRTFITYLPHVAIEAHFHNWPEGITGALRTFCEICMRNPRIVEACANIRFDEVEL